jgi:uncharacterized membrane protein (DUF106 family)
MNEKNKLNNLNGKNTDDIKISQKAKKAFIITSLIVIVLILFSYFFSSSLEKYVLESDVSSTTSLFILSLLVGLIDGFNPCAMWVLIYLITLVSQLKDRKKMWVIVGTFLLASGVLYFLILALWLNGWQYLNYITGASWILNAAAVFALGTGAYFVFDFIKSGGKAECKVGDFESRKKTTNKIKDIVNSPLTIPTFLALIVLAFAINLTEFVCSIGLPALFTQVLSLADVTVFMKYFYIGLYTLAFMADDLLIFYFALKAIDSPILDKYSGLSKIVGGVLMLLLGIVLLFFPEFLL